MSCSSFLSFLTGSTEWKSAPFTFALFPPSSHWLLHNWVWWGLLRVNLKRSLTWIQNNSPCRHAWAGLHCSTQCDSWLRHETEYAGAAWSGGADGRASLWLASFHDNQSERRPSAHFAARQRERPTVRPIDSDWEESGWREGRCGKGETINLPIHLASILTLSVGSITPSFGESKTERDERRTALSTSS